MANKNNIDVKELELNGQIYVRKDSVRTFDLSEQSIVRADSGVYFGKVVSQNDRTVVLENARQIWKFNTKGINTLDVASVGIHGDSRVTHVVPSVTVLDARTVVPCTLESATIISNWPVANS